VVTILVAGAALLQIGGLLARTVRPVHELSKRRLLF